MAAAAQIGAAFELLDYVGALEPVRLIDLAGQR
jgi:hypothetical protein